MNILEPINEMLSIKIARLIHNILKKEGIIKRENYLLDINDLDFYNNDILYAIESELSFESDSEFINDTFKNASNTNSYYYHNKISDIEYFLDKRLAYIDVFFTIYKMDEIVKRYFNKDKIKELFGDRDVTGIYVTYIDQQTFKISVTLEGLNGYYTIATVDINQLIFAKIKTNFVHLFMNLGLDGKAAEILTYIITSLAILFAIPFYIILGIFSKMIKLINKAKNSILFKNTQNESYVRYEVSRFNDTLNKVLDKIKTFGLTIYEIFKIIIKIFKAIITRNKNGELANLTRELLNLLKFKGKKVVEEYENYNKKEQNNNDFEDKKAEQIVNQVIETLDSITENTKKQVEDAEKELKEIIKDVFNTKSANDDKTINNTNDANLLVPLKTNNTKTNNTNKKDDIIKNNLLEIKNIKEDLKELKKYLQDAGFSIGNLENKINEIINDEKYTTGKNKGLSELARVINGLYHAFSYSIFYINSAKEREDGVLMVNHVNELGSHIESIKRARQNIINPILQNQNIDSKIKNIVKELDNLLDKLIKKLTNIKDNAVKKRAELEANIENILLSLYKNINQNKPITVTYSDSGDTKVKINEKEIKKLVKTAVDSHYREAKKVYEYLKNNKNLDLQKIKEFYKDFEHWATQRILELAYKLQELNKNTKSEQLIIDLLYKSIIDG